MTMGQGSFGSGVFGMPVQTPEESLVCKCVKDHTPAARRIARWNGVPLCATSRDNADVVLQHLHSNAGKKPSYWTQTPKVVRDAVQKQYDHDLAVRASAVPPTT
jgi:hypothetical protein